MPNFSKPKVTVERVDIDPYELISMAKQYAERGDYYSAERTYVAASNASMGTSSQNDVVAKVKRGLSSIYNSWAEYCSQNYRFQEAEITLKKALKIKYNIRDVKTNLCTLYEKWGDCLKVDGKLEGAETRYFLALQIEREIGTNETQESNLIRKIKEIKYLYNSDEEKELSYYLYVLESGKGFADKAVIFEIIGVICIFSAIAYHGNDDVFWLVLAIMILSPFFVLFNSFSCERLLARGMGIFIVPIMFFWTIVGILFCARDPLYAFYPAVVGIYCIYFALKIKKLAKDGELYDRVMRQLASQAASISQEDITVEHVVGVRI